MAKYLPGHESCFQGIYFYILWLWNRFGGCISIRVYARVSYKFMYVQGFLTWDCFLILFIEWQNIKSVTMGFEVIKLTCHDMWYIVYEMWIPSWYVLRKRYENLVPDRNFQGRK